MSISKFYNRASNKLQRLINERRGWTTDRKLLVIESDDWGAVRMPNRSTYESILKTGIRVDESHYNKFDTLASIADFEHLYSVLSKFKDIRGNPPIITANTIVANPDFDRIRESDFKRYYYESFTDTLKKYNNRSINSWMEGIENDFIFPQLHGREHLNVERWMRYLQSGSKEVHFAFDHRLFGIGPKISLEKNPSFVQAFNSKDFLENEPLNKILIEADNIFNKVFGFHSKSFIAPNYFWDSDVEKCLSELGVKYLQGMVRQNLVDGSKYNYIGKENIYDQVYLIRNVFFEPSADANKDWVSSALQEVEFAFKNKKPAIVSMHRVNFIGEIFEFNRINNLTLFNSFLIEIQKRWPEVEFMHSSDLGDLIIDKE